MASQFDGLIHLTMRFPFPPPAIPGLYQAKALEPDFSRQHKLHSLPQALALSICGLWLNLADVNEIPATFSRISQGIPLTTVDIPRYSWSRRRFHSTNRGIPASPGTFRSRSDSNLDSVIRTLGRAEAPHGW